ncbi:hypothetical protein MMC20_007706 [Loxospora ochrophaea]|nr:hypothetical protein [Loxospora ochrophaea]
MLESRPKKGQRRAQSQDEPPPQPKDKVPSSGLGLAKYGAALRQEARPPKSFMGINHSVNQSSLPSFSLQRSGNASLYVRIYGLDFSALNPPPTATIIPSQPTTPSTTFFHSPPPLTPLPSSSPHSKTMSYKIPAPTSLLTGVVVSTCKAAKAVKVRIAKQTYDSYLRKARPLSLFLPAPPLPSHQQTNTPPTAFSRPRLPSRRGPLLLPPHRGRDPTRGTMAALAEDTARGDVDCGPGGGTG